LMVQARKVFWLRRSSVRENRASASLLLHKLRDVVLLRFALLIIGGMMLPLSSSGRNTAIASLLLALFAEGLGRWLFFVSVVPKNMASSFLSGERAA
jgi:formate dehydrogenase iron-sulfur subunit